MSDVLVLAPISHAALGSLKQRLTVTVESWLETGRLQDPEELGGRLRQEQVRYLVVEADFVLRETIEQASALRLVTLCRNALNQVDVTAATEHGVLVTNTPGRNALAVAELTLALVLSLARPVAQAHLYVRSGAWQHPTEPYARFRGTELAGRTAGVIGFGGIGRLVATRLQALGMHILATDPLVEATDMRLKGVEKAPLTHLLARSDYVLVHAPAVPGTLGLIGRREFQAMKPTAFLVNTSAAGVVDEAALVDALRNRHIAGAALDVFDGQPLPPSSPLLTLDNVLLTPHIGGATAETIERYSAMAVEDIQSVESGVRPLRLVEPAAWERYLARRPG